MGNYPTFYCHLHWAQSRGRPDLPEVILRSQPRIGEAIWVPNIEGHNYLVRVQDVIHVAETEDEFPYLEIWVALEERRVVEEEEEEEEEEDKVSAHLMRAAQEEMDKRRRYRL